MNISRSNVAFGTRLKVDKVTAEVLNQLGKENPKYIKGFIGLQDFFQKNTNQITDAQTENIVGLLKKQGLKIQNAFEMLNDPDGILTIKNLKRTKKYFTQEGPLMGELEYMNPKKYADAAVKLPLRIEKEIFESKAFITNFLVNTTKVLIEKLDIGDMISMKPNKIQKAGTQAINELLSEPAVPTPPKIAAIAKTAIENMTNNLN